MQRGVDWRKYMEQRVAGVIEWVNTAKENQDEEQITEARNKLSYIKNKAQHHHFDDLVALICKVQGKRPPPPIRS